MKRIFYNKRHRLPVWSQIYVFWAILFLVSVLWIYKFETVKTSVDESKSFDYKKTYDIISGTYLNVQNKYPGVTGYDKSLIETLKGNLKVKSWNVDMITFTENKISCKVVRYYPVSEKQSLAIIFDHHGFAESFYPIQTLVQTLINNGDENVSIFSMEGHPICSDYLLKRTEFAGKTNSGYIYIYPEKRNASGLQVTLPEYNSSSIQWSSIIPASELRPGIFNQLMTSAIPLFQRVALNPKNANAHSIGWYFPESYFQKDVDQIRHIIPGLIFTIENYGKIKNFTQKNFIWINAKTSISKTGLIILSCMLILLTWLPVVNRLYQNENVRSIVGSYFTAIFSSILFFILILLIRVFSIFIPDSILGIVIVFGIFVGLYYIFKRIRNAMFYSNVSSITEFIVFNTFATLLALNNFSLFLFFIPLIFVMSTKSDLDRGIFKLLIVASLLPFFYVLFILTSYQNYNTVFSLIWINKALFINFTATIMFIFLCGSMLSIVRESK